MHRGALEPLTIHDPSTPYHRHPDLPSQVGFSLLTNMIFLPQHRPAAASGRRGTRRGPPATTCTLSPCENLFCSMEWMTICLTRWFVFLLLMIFLQRNIAFDQAILCCILFS